MKKYAELASLIPTLRDFDWFETSAFQNKLLPSNPFNASKSLTYITTTASTPSLLSPLLSKIPDGKRVLVHGVLGVFPSSADLHENR